MREDPCTRCGACCAAFRVDFHRSELASATPGGVPAAFTVPVTASRPSPCQEFAPYAPLGIGDDACARARIRHGLAPL